MDKETIEKLRQDLPEEFIIKRGEAKDYTTGETIFLVGYRWQNIVTWLTDQINGEWCFQIDKVWDDMDQWYVMATLFIEDNYRCQIGSAQKAKGKKIDQYSIKAAVDDAFSRCCAMFEIGMKAYLGKENRHNFQPKKNQNIEQLKTLMKNRKVQDLQDSLLSNGFDISNLPVTDENFDNTHKLIDLQNISEDQAKSIILFLREIRAAKVLKELCNHYNYTAVSQDFSRVNILIKKYGSDIVKKAIKKFIGAKKEDTRIAREEMMQGAPDDKWNYITKICNTEFEKSGKVNEKAKEEIETDMKMLGSGHNSNPAPY